MRYRSWMFVPGDSEKKLAKATSLGADVLILDLEDAVASQNKARGRAVSAEWLSDNRRKVEDAGAQVWVRINALDTSLWRDDVAAVVGHAPSGLMVPKAANPQQLHMLAGELYESEQAHGLAPHSVKLLPLVSETPAAALTIVDYATDTLPRLAGLSWGAEDLSAAIGASRKRDHRGEWTDAFRLIRAQVLLAAHAREILAIDTLHANFRDLDGLKKIAEGSYADGFAGMLAIHPAQVQVINEAFSPSAERIAEARAIVDAFATNPGVGALQVDGKMVDQPHLEGARRLLEGVGG